MEVEVNKILKEEIEAAMRKLGDCSDKDHLEIN